MSIEPHSPPEPLLTLADVLEARFEECIHRWTARLRESRAGDGSTQSALADQLGDYLRQVVALLRHHGRVEERAVPSADREHGNQRPPLGFDVTTLVHEYNLLHECILELVEESGVCVPLSELRTLTSLLARSMTEDVAEYFHRQERAHQEDKSERAALLRPREQHAEQELHQSEERFRLLVEGVKDYAIFMLEPDGRVASWNAGAERIKGWKAEEILGRPFTLFYPPEDVAAGVPQQGLSRAAREGHHHTEGWRLRKDGSRFWADVLVTPLRDERGALLGYVKITRDISEQRRAEEAQRETSQRLQAILNTAVDGIITIDERGRIQSVNPATEHIFGYTPEELLGRNINVLMPEPYRSEHDGYMDSYLRTGERKVIGIGREALGRRKDGSHFPLDLSISEVHLPQGRFFTGIIRDITARKRAEEAQTLFVELGSLLSQSLDVTHTLKSLASLVVSRLADWCTVDLLDQEGVLHRLEVAAREPEHQELLHQAMRYPPLAGSHSPMALPLESGQPLVVPEVTSEWLAASARDEEHRLLLERLAPRTIIIVPLMARGRKLGLLNFTWTRPRTSTLPADLEVARGVADRAAVAIDNARLYEEAQEAIRAREDVVAIVSHDLRNPLNAVVLAASALLKRKGVDEQTTKAARSICSAANRATRMIRDLLDFSQARQGVFPVHHAPLNFHEHVRRVVEEVRLAWPERQLELHASDDGQGEWDADRLAQVVTNLVGNALQHGPPDQPVRITTRSEGPTVTLEVHNAGPSIPAELLPRLFEPYRRGPEAGAGRGSLGLGLFITRQIVLSHGGSITVRSTAEDGTTFTVRLPRLAAEAVPD